MRAPKSFEEGMNRLEAILDQMQQPETTLAESVKLYAEAASLTEYCRNTLEKAILNQSKRLVADPDASLELLLPGDFELE